MKKYSISFLVLFCFLFFFVKGTFAVDLSTNISGYVTDSSAGPLENITVKVTCNGVTKYWVTDENGFYKVNYLRLVCRRGEIVNAEATYNGEKMILNQVVEDDTTATINFPFGAVGVPEFGMIPGIVAAVGSGLGYLGLRRKMR